MSSAATRLLLNNGPTLEGLPSLAFAEAGISTDQNFVLVGTGTSNPHLIQTTHSTVLIDYSDTPGVAQKRLLLTGMSTPAMPGLTINRNAAYPTGLFEPVADSLGVVVLGVEVGRFTPTGLTLYGALTYAGAGGVIVSYNTTSNRPTTPLHGFIWHNTTLNILEWWDGAAWRSVAESGGGGGAGLSPWVTKTANYNAVAGERLICNTDAGAFTVTFPAAPADKAEIDIMGDFAVRNLTINPNGKTIARSSTNFVFNEDNIGAKFVYDAGIGGWRIWP